MSESLKLVGFKRILNHATNDGSATKLSLVPPPKGNAHFVARWWDKKANQKIYISCTKLAIEGSDLEIVVPSSFSTRLAITFDGDVNNLVFGVRMDVSRVALIDKNTGEIALQYVFPAIKNRTAKIAKIVNDDYDDGTPEPTPEPTPTPTPTPPPTPEPTPEPTPTPPPTPEPTPEPDPTPEPTPAPTEEPDVLTVEIKKTKSSKKK